MSTRLFTVMSLAMLLSHGIAFAQSVAIESARTGQETVAAEKDALTGAESVRLFAGPSLKRTSTLVPFAAAGGPTMARGSKREWMVGAQSVPGYRQAASARTAGGERGVTSLAPGAPKIFELPAVNGPTLCYGDFGFQVDVPEGVTSVEFRLTTETPNVDVDLYVRRGEEPGLSGGRVVTDFRSEGPGGSEVVRVSTESNPALRAGRYFVAFGLFTARVAVRGTIAVTFTGGGAQNVGGSEVQRQVVPVRLPAVTRTSLYYGELGYRFTVPEGASRLKVNLSTVARDVDVDLYLRRQQDVDLSGGDVVADFLSEGPAGEETIIVTPTSNPALRAGEYFVAYGVYTLNQDIEANLTIEIEGVRSGNVLTSGTPASVVLPAVETSMLFHGDFSYRIAVPAGASKLTIRLEAEAPGTELMLFARSGRDIDWVNNVPVSDFVTATAAASQTMVITPSSTPALAPGVYYIAIATRTVGKVIRATLTATVEGAAGDDPAQLLQSGIPMNFTLPAVDRPAVFFGPMGYRIVVPANARQLQVRLATATADVDLDLAVRFGVQSEVRDGDLVADHFADGYTGNEVITITSASRPALRAGTYYINLVSITTGRAATGTVTATVTQ